MNPNIPYEVWEQIFIRCLPSDDFMTPSPATAPLLLCSVCKKWRDIALSIPLLWSSISIKVARPGCKPDPNLVTTWIQRTDGRPVDIFLTLEKKPGFNAFNNVDAATNSVIDFFAQWQNVVLRLGPFIKLQTLYKIPHVQAPFFESLELFLPSSYAKEAKLFENLAEHAPNLQRLKISAELQGEEIPGFQFPFSKSLKYLILDSAVFSINTCIEILSQCRGLVEFQAHDTSGHSTHSPRADPVTLDHLRIFTLSTAAYGIAHLTENITLPALTHFALASPYNIPWRSLTRLFSRSNCPLAELVLSGGGSEAEVKECLLTCAHSLKKLHLHTTDSRYVGNQIMQSLTIETAKEIPFPFLMDISLGHGVIEATDGTLSHMLHSRAQMGENDRGTNATISLYLPATHTYDISQLSESPPPFWTINLMIEA
jgi:hypothetical protein